MTETRQELQGSPTILPLTEERRKNLRAEIGQRIKARRQGCDITQDEVAAVLGVDRSAISRIEAGLTALTAEKIALLGRLLQVPTSALIDGVGSE